MLTRELQTYRTLTRTQKDEGTVNMVNCRKALKRFFHRIIQSFKLFRTTCIEESRNLVFDRSDRMYTIYPDYTCNTGEDITCI